MAAAEPWVVVPENVSLQLRKKDLLVLGNDAWQAQSLPIIDEGLGLAAFGARTLNRGESIESPCRE